MDNTYISHATNVNNPPTISVEYVAEPMSSLNHIMSAATSNIMAIMEVRTKNIIGASTGPGVGLLSSIVRRLNYTYFSSLQWQRIFSASWST
jgi:hypothetical protein